MCCIVLFVMPPTRSSSPEKQLQRCFHRWWKLLLLTCAFWIFSHDALRTLRYGRPPLRLLVSYVYYESRLQGKCEITNKRTNLAFFLKQAVLPSPKNLRFVFTVPERLPSTNEILRIVGFPRYSREGKIIESAMNNRLSNVQFRYISSSSPVPDLCHHQNTIRFEMKRPAGLDYVLILNDGARGPFLRAAEQGREEKSQQVRP